MKFPASYSFICGRSCLSLFHPSNLNRYYPQYLTRLKDNFYVYSLKYSFSLRVQGPLIENSTSLSLRDALTLSNYTKVLSSLLFSSLLFSSLLFSSLLFSSLHPPRKYNALCFLFFFSLCLILDYYPIIYICQILVYFLIFIYHSQQHIPQWLFVSIHAFLFTFLTSTS